MAFAARQEDGKWRLCLRKGRTIYGTKLSGQWENIEFATQAKAKACADIVNEKFWKEFETNEKKRQPHEEAWDMMDEIRKFTK